MKSYTFLLPVLHFALCAFCILLCVPSFSQDPVIEWDKTIGGTNSDVCVVIEPLGDGTFMLGGVSNSDISGDKTENSYGWEDYWVINMDAVGNVIWQKSYGGSGSDVFTSLSQTTDGGFILGGHSTSLLSGNKTEGKIGQEDYWVVKTDNTGNIEWQNVIGGKQEDKLNDIKQTSDGGYILAGYSISGTTGDKSQPSKGGYDYWIVKIDALGMIEWQKTIGGSSQDYLRQVIVSSDGGYLFLGESYSDISGDKTENSIGSTDLWIIKTDDLGNIEWQTTLGGTWREYIYTGIQTTDGGYLLGATSDSPVTGNKTDNTNGQQDYWIVKMSATGSIEWQNSIGGSLADDLYNLKQTDDGGYILIGSSISEATGDKTENRLGLFGPDYWVVKTDGLGNLEWQNTIGGDNSDDPYTICQTDDGGYLVGGQSSSNISGDKSESPIGAGDFWMVKLMPGCSPEICNGIDDDCSGVIDDGVVETINLFHDGNTTFCQGGSIVLTAVHSGTSIQWKKNGANIAGATSSTYSATKSGLYRAVTTSVCGTAESSEVFVMVNKNPNANITAVGSTTFCTGGSVTLNVIPVFESSYQWYKGATALAGATNTSYVATIQGNYKCRVTKTATGCYKNSNTISVTVPCKQGEGTTHSSLTTLSLYPNPSNGTFTIETNLAGQLVIYNSLGQTVFSKQIDAGEQFIQLNDIAPGMYFIRIQNDEHSSQQKIIFE